MNDNLTDDLFNGLMQIPLIDPHSHIDPRAAASKSLDDILGYHYYTELAHSAGLSKSSLGNDVPPRERVRAIIQQMSSFDNTAQYAWFLDIAKTFLSFEGNAITPNDTDYLFDKATEVFSQQDWEQQLFLRSNLEKVFLTNEFDDNLDGFDTSKYVPCLRTDTLVFQFDKAEVRARLTKVTGVEVGDLDSLRKSIWKLFAHFKAKGAKACAISLPPSFTPVAVSDGDMNRALMALRNDGMVARGVFEAVQLARGVLGGPNSGEVSAKTVASMGIFWLLAEHCREFNMPFDLMIGVNRQVYPNGVYQGQDLFDRRTSLHQYRDLFNAFPEVTFPISVLTSGQNQELVAYSWIFPNVVTNGHWWYSNIPTYIKRDTTERLQAVPKTKQIGYYSDAYKLEFILPKYTMYRKLLAETLAEEYVRPGKLNEAGAIALGKQLLCDNVQRIFQV